MPLPVRPWVRKNTEIYCTFRSESFGRVGDKEDGKGERRKEEGGDRRGEKRREGERKILLSLATRLPREKVSKRVNELKSCPQQGGPLSTSSARFHRKQLCSEALKMGLLCHPVLHLYRSRRFLFGLRVSGRSKVGRKREARASTEAAEVRPDFKGELLRGFFLAKAFCWPPVLAVWIAG